MELSELRGKITDMNKQPQNPFHPGEILLEEFLVPGKVNLAEFAQQLGWTENQLNDLIRGERHITTESAQDIARALGTTPDLWMNMQATYDHALAPATGTRPKGLNATPAFAP